jgi:CheY-like chemotaxis protein
VDVALVDIMMPDMDGYETMREMRSRLQFAELPIVAVTAKAMKGDRQKCLQAGATDYVSKPVDVDHLVSVLRVAVQRSDASRTLRPIEAAALPAAE